MQVQLKALYKCYICVFIFTTTAIDPVKKFKMMMKISVCVLIAFFQVAFSQQYSGYNGNAKSQAEMWDPNTWIAPLYSEAANAWVNYYKKAQEATGQLYKQWDATGAGDLFNTGMKFAQLAAQEAQKYAQAGFGQGDQAAKAAMGYANQGAQLAQQEAAKAAQYFTG